MEFFFSISTILVGINKTKFLHCNLMTFKYNYECTVFRFWEGGKHTMKSYCLQIKNLTTHLFLEHLNENKFEKVLLCGKLAIEGYFTELPNCAWVICNERNQMWFLAEFNILKIRL